MRFFLGYFGVFCCLLMTVSCQRTIQEPVAEDSRVDTMTAMEHVYERGALVAATNWATLNYRLLDGRPAGLHFELLDNFCDYLGVDLVLRVDDSMPHGYDLLREHAIDLFAGVFDTLVIDTAFHYLIFSSSMATDYTFAWVIPDRNDTTLTVAVDAWMADFESQLVRRTFNRYLRGGKARSDAAFRDTDHISPYDALIRVEATREGWDWRLIAAIIYQESHFKPDLENPSGAYGLMQLMPVTMRKYGIDYDSPVEDQIAAGVKLLSHLSQKLPESIADSVERVHFSLACYNAGLSQVLEARRRAERHGHNPDVWTDNVELYTPRQTYYFVREVTKRYSHYKALIE